ncbi:MAG: hypothetical protein GXP33_05985 [Spirochaetes bacterium]|nr:hypothetical protein [Spirochaetota bacterium]
MIAFKDLKDILKLAVKWEKKLKDFYDVAEFALSDKKSKGVIAVLRENLLKNIHILENISIADYGTTEWVRYASEHREEELIPVKRITRESKPEEIFHQILDYQAKLKDFYSTILNNLITDKQKELFESLVKFQEEQIYETTNFMKKYKP